MSRLDGQLNMGLVDYSDSESDSDPPPSSTPATASTAPPAKKQFQKLVDSTNSGKILVNLPSAPAKDDAAPIEEPAAKRAKTGGSRFSGFGSFLPPPKTTKAAVGAGSATKAAPRVGINLKTSSEAAFVRDSPPAIDDESRGADGPEHTTGLGGVGMKLPPPKASAQPSVLGDLDSKEAAEPVGNPVMFKPLSVSRKPAKKNGARASGPSKAAATANAPAQDLALAQTAQKLKAAATPKKKVSLFLFGDDTPPVGAATGSEESTPYEPEFTSYDNSAYNDAQQQYATYTQPLSTVDVDPTSLDAIADDLNLDPVARRELFGRGGGSSKATAKSVINFNLDQEYRHNEELRASGALEQQQHNPLRAIKPGKHSLQQLVNQVQSQRDALEENFAKNRSTQKQAGSKYGFR